MSNREVKSDCADGTAVMWESMSLPFFRKACPIGQAFLFLISMDMTEVNNFLMGVNILPIVVNI